MFKTKRAYFECPFCKTTFGVPLNGERFICHHCHHSYLLLDLGRGKHGWMEEPHCGWTLPISYQIHPFAERLPSRSIQPAAPPGDSAALGAARQRQRRRQSWHKGAGMPLGMLALTLLGLALLFSPIAAKGQPSITDASTFLPAKTGLSPSPTPTATQPTPTPSPTFTPAPTATPLPPSLVTATAWQEVYQRALINSHATQTQAAGSYAATQTALPPLLTAMAEERAAAAVQKAALKTQAANKRP